MSTFIWVNLLSGTGIDWMGAAGLRVDFTPGTLLTGWNVRLHAMPDDMCCHQPVCNMYTRMGQLVKNQKHLLLICLPQVLYVRMLAKAASAPAQ
jgi:hypothetical protein